MGKANNLGDFMTDLADAIREKTGATEPINPQDFSDTIKGITTGGGVVSMPPNNVNFRDYDGTILHSYSKDEFLSLTGMPPLPTREGLICQEWNWDFADAVEYVSEYGGLEVGATYITDDGKTRLYITITAEGRTDVPLYLNQTVANGVTINWGDGSATQTLSGTGNVNTTHHYNTIGDYVISLEVAEGCALTLGQKSSAGVFGSSSDPSVYRTMLTKVEGGKYAKFSSYAFRGCCSLLWVVIPPEGIVRNSSYTFGDCYSLQSVVYPKTMTITGAYELENCCSLWFISYPGTTTQMPSAALRYCYSLKSLYIPHKVGSIQTYFARECKSLSSLIIPKNIPSISAFSFYGCVSLVSVKMPKISTIERSLFDECTSMAFYDFSTFEAVPTLSNTSAFSNIPSDCKIIVPDALYDTWIAATNWSTYASNIIKKSEWDALSA